ncbi:hypothetical protein F2Q70_00035756 [Brassica cretica]|uniref:Uncharacterized protein n=1 Tax=Brassica cretica TaxID=69181 RepID=A0A8S9GA36_BRACR|nr:hypothetical protein F2Q68_00030971 [Brassica cretica]KAF2585347.1 hypothetical protein F2Q70_00035756 [Brassica cretica]
MAIEPPLGKFGELEGNRSNANEGEKSGVTHGRQEERLTAEKGLSEKIDAGSDGSIRNATYEVDLAENGVNLSKYRIVDGKEELVAKEGGSEKRIGNGNVIQNKIPADPLVDKDLEEDQKQLEWKTIVEPNFGQYINGPRSKVWTEMN